MDPEPAAGPAGERLSSLVERWHDERPSGPWLRARWPYPDIGLPILARIADLDVETTSVALSPDGSVLCTGGGPGVRTWDPLSGAPLAGHDMEGDYVTDLVFTSLDEIVAGTGNGSVLVFGVTDLALRRAGGPLGGGKVHIAALPGGRVAVATDEGQLAVWDAGTGDWLESASPGGMISAVAASPDGAELLVGTDGYEQNRVRRFRVGQLEAGATWEQETSSSIMDVGWSGDGRTLAWTEYDGTLVISAESSPQQRVSMPDGANAWALTFADGDRAVACNTAEDLSRLLIVDIATARTCVMVPSHRETAYSLSADAKRRYLASGGDEEIRVWDVAELLAGDHRIARAVMPDVARFLPDGRLLVAAEDRDAVRVVDLDGGAVERELPGHAGGVKRLAVAPDGRFACAAGDGEVLLWDPGTWTAEVVTRHNVEAGAVAFSQDGARLATGGGDGIVRLLDLASGAEVASLSLGYPVTDIAISPDGRDVAVETFASFSVVSLAGDAQRTVDVEARSYGLAFTPDGAQVAYVASGAVVLAADARTGADVPPTADHEAAFLAALGCRDPRWAWRSPRGRDSELPTKLEMPLVELATGRAVAWFPLVWATATPDVTGRTWALVTKQELYVLTLEDA
jgi:WD40 repeat protein